MKYELQVGMKNPILRKKSENIVNFNSDIKKFEKTLIKNMKKYEGQGIAAPQIGENIRMVICVLNKGKKQITMCNPEILFFSKDKEYDQEGCLSLPNVWGDVNRSKSVLLKYQDVNGKSVQLKLEGVNARVIQHEIDHLDGILFLDRVEGEFSISKDADLKKLQISNND